MRKFIYTLIGAIVSLFINLVASFAVQQPFFKEITSTPGIVILVIAIVLGLGIGIWLENKQNKNQQVPSSQATNPKLSGTVINRFKQWWSRTRLSGLGIELNDVISVGSQLDVTTTATKKRANTTHKKGKAQQSAAKSSVAHPTKVNKKSNP